MNFKELFEGTTPKLPGAPGGIQIMTPQQFVAKSGDMPGEDEQEVAEADKHSFIGKIQRHHELKKKVDQTWKDAADAEKRGDPKAANRSFEKHVRYANLERPGTWRDVKEQGVAEAAEGSQDRIKELQDYIRMKERVLGGGNALSPGERKNLVNARQELKQLKRKKQGVAEGYSGRKNEDGTWTVYKDGEKVAGVNPFKNKELAKQWIASAWLKDKNEKQGVAESEDHLSRIRKLSGLDEEILRPGSAVRVLHKGRMVDGKVVRYDPGKNGYSPAYVVDIGEYESKWVPAAQIDQKYVNEADSDLLGAQTRQLGKQEFQDYMGRIASREKHKTDKYKLPYIHRSSVVTYYNEAGKKYDEGQVIDALKQRPKKLLKQNEKMKHSNGELEQFFNVGFAALVGIAVNEKDNSLVVVNTCPGAGSCKVDCFAMKGGKIQFQGPWLSDGRILTYLLNDPKGFFEQLNREIKKEEKLGDKGGYTVTIRWHDAGDFFSPEYTDMAFSLARDNPDVLFYAYTKMADVVLAEKPANFIINWSEGAHTSQEKKVKAADPELEQTKNSRIVPSNLFYDLLVKDEKKNLVKGPEGQWQVMPDKLNELKQRLASEYGISTNSILSYDEWDRKTNGGSKETPIKYNVIIAPGEPDVTARSHGVLSTLLLKH